MLRTLAAFLAFVAWAQAGAWLDVPYVHQEHNGCGSAALSMVIGYWQRNGAAVPPSAADERTIQRALYSKEASGIYASAMVDYLERNGFRAFPFQGAWTDLSNHLAKGRPLIVSLGGSRMHYVVIAGVDSQHDLLFVNDPAGRKLMKWERKSFEHAWKNHWTLLAVPRSDQ